MISRWGSAPTSTLCRIASMAARTWARYNSGRTTPRRTPRSPIIGFDSSSRFTAPSMRSISVVLVPAALARIRSSTRSSREGRNSCSGGSSRRTTTGLPSMAASRSSKSSAWSFSRVSSAPAASSSRMTRRTMGRRSPMNMCSVRARPIPSAPQRAASRAPAPSSALARTPMVRMASAHPSSTSSSGVGSGLVRGSPPR